jgi:hypothetical protein
MARTRVQGRGRRRTRGARAGSRGGAWRGWAGWSAWTRPLPLAAYVLLALAALFAVNVCYQLVRKPTELLGLVVPTSTKAPAVTWEAYGSLLEEHATAVIRPELLAALVQVESAGDPLARTYWRWQWSWNPLEIHAPASSAVGMLQITDGTFDEARRLCIHDHEVARDGAWYDPTACWFNGLYFRTFPGDAIEMTAARLHLLVAEIADPRAPRATADQRQRLAAVIHLCGRERGVAYASRGFRVLPGERCGDHDLARYLARVDALRAEFTRLGERG